MWRTDREIWVPTWSIFALLPVGEMDQSPEEVVRRPQVGCILKLGPASCDDGLDIVWKEIEESGMTLGFWRDDFLKGLLLWRRNDETAARRQRYLFKNFFDYNRKRRTHIRRPFKKKCCRNSETLRPPFQWLPPKVSTSLSLTPYISVTCVDTWCTWNHAVCTLLCMDFFPPQNCAVGLIYTTACI